MNYLYFDQDFNLIPDKSGYQKVDNGSSGAFDILEVNNLTFDEGGYLYVYVSNERNTSTGGDACLPKRGEGRFILMP